MLAEVEKVAGSEEAREINRPDLPDKKEDIPSKGPIVGFLQRYWQILIILLVILAAAYGGISLYMDFQRILAGGEF